MLIIADYKTHQVGAVEVFDWERRINGQLVTYRDVPVMYVRDATLEEWEAEHPGVSLEWPHRSGPFFYLVSVDDLRPVSPVGRCPAGAPAPR